MLLAAAILLLILAGAAFALWLRARLGPGRRRSPHLLAAAALLLLAAAGAGVQSVRANLATMDWNDYKPATWLVHETTSPDLETAWLALSQLIARADRGKLADDTLLHLAVQALDYRDSGAPCGKWPLEFGNLVDLAWERGLLSDEQKLRYALHAAAVVWSGPYQIQSPDEPSSPKLTIRPRLYVGQSSFSQSTFRPIDFEVRELAAHLNNEPLPVDLKVSSAAGAGGRSKPDVSTAVAVVEFPETWAGRELRLDWHIQIVNFQTRAPIGEPWIASRTFKLDSAIAGGARRQDDKPPPPT